MDPSSPDQRRAPAVDPVTTAWPNRTTPFRAPIDPASVSSLPLVRRLRLRVLIPALLAALMIIGSITTAVLSLRQKPTDDGLAPTGSARAVREARIEAPFAPATLRPLSPEQAVAWNAATPADRRATETASAFLLRTSKASDFQRSLQCLTMAVYYEAGSETDDGERAVAQVILNRVRHPAYPKTVCGVVLDGAQRGHGCQFTFVCDGAMARTPSIKGWERAARVATAALGGAVFAPVGWATHYHANYVVPYWAASLDKVALIGAHIFYRWTGLAGRATAFRAAYAGNEPALTIPAVDSATATSKMAGAGAGDASGTVPPTDRPVLTVPRVGDGSDARTPIIGLGERRVLSRGSDIGGTTAPMPTSPERRVLPTSPAGAT